MPCSGICILYVLPLTGTWLNSKLTFHQKIYSDPDRDILIQLSSQLSGLLRELLLKNPESFIFPNMWPKYRDTLRSSFSVGDDVPEGAHHKVQARNARLSVANTTSAPVGRQDLVKLLDLAAQGRGDRDLATKCWATLDDKAEIVKITVEWATSLHRPGLAKIYVVARLLKSWSIFNINATQPILDILSDIQPADKRRSKCVFHLVAELVRSRLFSVARYMQWLIGRGGLQDASDIDPDDGPCATRLLIELPINCLPESQRAQRSNLLRRAGQYSTTDEANDISNALRCVDDTLGLSPHLANAELQIKCSPQRCFPLRKLLRRVGNSGKAVQTAIGAHLRDVFTADLLGKVDSVIVRSIFHSVRAMLETIEDFHMLSHILKVCSTASDVEVLAACVDTINSHLEVFLALGCADALFAVLVDRLKAVNREQGVTVRPLLAALCSLARRLPHQEDIAKQLVRELALSDRSNAIDACSPVSDNMAMQTQGADGEVSEQIDKLLASGNTIDHPTMNRLFRNIIPKVESGWAKGDESRRVFASLLTRLRIFDTQHFDKLMADWASHILTLRDRPPLLELFPLLASLGCLPISTMLHTANAGTPAVEDAPLHRGDTPPGSAVYLQELLQLLITALPKSTPLDSDETYRFEIQQKSARSEQPKGLLLLIRNALVEYSALRERAPGRTLLLDDVVYEDRLLETLKYLVVADSTAVAQVLNIGNLPVGVTSWVHKIITKLLIPDDDGDSETSFDQILGLANELAMPFCQLKLNVDLAAPQRTLKDVEDDNSSRFEAFAKAMDRAIEARNIMWTGMLPCLSQDITRNLSSQAHLRFLDLIPSLKSGSIEEDAASEHRVHLAENLLGVLEAINSGQLSSKSAQLTANLVDKLSDLWEIVASNDEERVQARKEVLSHWLPMLLRFITLNSVSPEPLQIPNPSQPNASRVPIPPNYEARARIILVLCGLLLELDSQAQTARSALSQEVFDIAIVLVDALPDDLRLQCARIILFMPGGTASTSTSSDPRLYYLFSVPQPTSAENLKLAHRDKASVPYSAAARGMGAMYGIGPASQERLTPFMLRRWEILSEPTPNVGERTTRASASASLRPSRFSDFIFIGVSGIHYSKFHSGRSASCFLRSHYFTFCLFFILGTHFSSTRWAHDDFMNTGENWGEMASCFVSKGYSGNAWPWCRCSSVLLLVSGWVLHACRWRC